MCIYKFSNYNINGLNFLFCYYQKVFTYVKTHKYERYC